MKTFRLIIVFSLLLTGCNFPTQAGQVSKPNPLAVLASTVIPSRIPVFEHVILIVLENRAYSEVYQSPKAPYLNELANKNVLLTNNYAIAHPSLPNYIALMSGSTHNITSDCINCFLNVTSLPDLVEKSGRSWRAYAEGLPSPCFVGNAGKYMQKHNPLIYFDSIRTDTARCERGIVPLGNIDEDLAANQLPNLVLLEPNMCHSGHDCDLATADQWVKMVVTNLLASQNLGQKYLIAITFDEGSDADTAPCCGLSQTGGHVFTVLVSPLAKPGYQDNTAYSHYSLLRTILGAWGLPNLGLTALPGTKTIDEPWH